MDKVAPVLGGLASSLAFLGAPDSNETCDLENWKTGFINKDGTHESGWMRQYWICIFSFFKARKE